MAVKLGELKLLPIREVFPHEEYDFTKHFEDPKNLNRLGAALGLNLELIETESRVGRYEADILAKCNEENVIIENQYGWSDHDHFGKLLTYSAGKDANILIWVVENARDEHRAAIKQLNDKSDLNIYMVEIKAISIVNSETGEQSLPTLDYDVVEKPNEVIKETEVAKRSENVGYKSFWNKLIEAGEADKEFSSKYSFYAPNKAFLKLRFTGKLNERKNDVSVAFTLTQKKLRVEVSFNRDFYNANCKNLYETIENGISVNSSEETESETWNLYTRQYAIDFDFNSASTWNDTIAKQIRNAIKVKEILESNINV